MMSEAVSPIASRRDLIREVHVYAKADTARGVALFLLDLGLHAAAIAGVLFLPALWMKVASAIFAGMTLGRIFSLAHNAAHENIVEGQRLNRFMAIVLFLPIFYNYRLWVYEHHALHHPFTNDTKSDAYKPFSKQEFDALPSWRRALERFYRSPTIVGWGFYYLLQRHFSTKICPPAYVPSRLRPAAWWNTALLALYATAFFTLLIAAPHFAVNLTSTAALVLGFAVPFLVFEVHDGFALYAQHTDPRIPWFKGDVDRSAEGRTELLSVHLLVPRLMGWFYHDTFAHPVHHLHPKIPCYRAYEAQTLLDQRLGCAAVVSKFGVRWLLDTMRCCKLYDWDKQQWLAFDGAPTAEPFRIGQYSATRDEGRAKAQSGLAQRRAEPVLGAR